MLHLTVIHTTDPPKIGKGFRLRGGALVADHHPLLVAGPAEVVSVADLSAFADLLGGLDAGSQVLTYGRLAADAVEIVTKAHEGNGAIARTRDSFSWPSGPGIVLLDYDAGEVDDMHEVAAILTDAQPALDLHQQLWWPSSSSHICKAGGRDLTGLRGARGYMIAKDARDIPRAMVALVARLWLRGHGRIDVSASGQLLERCILDSSVWQPERLDFAAGAVCGEGLEQRRGEPVLLNPDRLPVADTRGLFPPLNRDEARAFDLIKTRAKAAKMTAAEAQRAIWARARDVAAIMRDRPSLTEAEVEAAADADRATRAAITKLATAPRAVLPAGHVLHVSKSETVAAGDITADWQGRRLCDPLEPDYRGWNRCTSVLLVGGRVTLKSWAHGTGRLFNIEGPKE
ncbi:hypothetical protein PAF17_19370 [Paracoccus sp. Z330]|uniref:Uncharacterized protein n=1 Tax=Paracoccus onchidii TaxID=3017813 RepID=A0ABT4ZKL7_9RHOB|nr:hypothetical protein [Paracoccus onchidii]MDB6179627.1 hypothetical protein [Paracoccus onchidii]